MSSKFKSQLWRCRADRSIEESGIPKKYIFKSNIFGNKNI
jgi:hypothetical protein